MRCCTRRGWSASGPLGGFSAPVATILLLSLALVAYVGARLSLAPALAADGKALSVLQSWRLTRGRGWMLVGAWIVVHVPLLLGVMAVQALQWIEIDDPSIGVHGVWPMPEAIGAGALLGVVIAIVQAPLTVALYSGVYQRLTAADAPSLFAAARQESALAFADPAEPLGTDAPSAEPLHTFADRPAEREPAADAAPVIAFPALLAAGAAAAETLLHPHASYASEPEASEPAALSTSPVAPTAAEPEPVIVAQEAAHTAPEPEAAPTHDFHPAFAPLSPAEPSPAVAEPAPVADLHPFPAWSPGAVDYTVSTHAPDAKSH